MSGMPFYSASLERNALVPGSRNTHGTDELVCNIDKQSKKLASAQMASEHAAATVVERTESLHEMHILVARCGWTSKH